MTRIAYLVFVGSVVMFLALLRTDLGGSSELEAVESSGVKRVAAYVVVVVMMVGAGYASILQLVDDFRTLRSRLHNGKKN